MKRICRERCASYLGTSYELTDLQQRTIDDLLAIRYQRLMGFGSFVEEVVK
ncbi:MAG: hypothetical protein HOP36_01005 [Methyloglobulus sp.]|nr:hypothetical protein [Methyloglobulus sp.]